MSQELIKQFIDAMIAAECAPADESDIRSDDKRNYFRVAGDKPGRKRGAYRLKLENDYGVGWFVDYRNGELIKWVSKSNRKFTPEEKSAWKAKIEDDRTEKDKEQRELYKLAAIKADKIWKSAQREGTTEYLTNKKLSGLHGARIRNGLLVIPGYKDGKVSTLQFIAANGDKRFLTDGEKSGSYFPIASAGENLSVIVICEGFSTGASIREATGYPVVVAWDAGNLAAVAKVIRAKYPNAEIIFAADNDSWTLAPKFKPKDVDVKSLPADSPFWESWREQGYLHNTGVVNAQQAAVAIGGARVVIPRFKDTSSFPTDCNDLSALQGLDDVKRLFDKPELTPIEETSSDISEAEWEAYHAALPEDEEAAAQVQLYTAAPEKRQDDVNWKSRLAYKENGSLQGTSLANALLFIEHDKVLKNIACYDSFSHELTVYQCPPWEEADKFRPHMLQDTDITHLTAYMERFGLKVGMQSIQKALHAIVKKNAKNPAQEYFNGLKWDGIKRLDTWLQDYCGASEEPAAYVSAIGRKWLCASVRRVMEPGTKFDCMLILEGKQGIRKSTLFRELATIHGKAYFDDTLRIEHLTDSKFVTRFQGKLIMEIAELAGIHRADVEKLKGALSVQEDSITLKYENNTTKYPRQFILGGTVNRQEGNGYLSDPTGNRRYWPVSVGLIDIEGIRKVKEQIWAEAVRVCQNEELYLTGEIAELQVDVVNQRLSIHPWMSEISKFVKNKHTIGKDDIWDALDIKDRTKRTSSANAEISKIMTRLGYKNKQIMVSGNREYMWVLERKDEELPLE